MARIVVLDSGPLRLAAGRRGMDAVDRFREWRLQARFNGLILVIPAVADYEVRRELLRAGGTAGVRRLDDLRHEMVFAPATDEAWKRVAELWAEARRHGIPTATDKAIDGDVIVAAQALCFAGSGDDLTVATQNVKHLARFADVRRWEDIDPRL